MIDYGIFYRQDLRTADDWNGLPQWDLFLSAFNKSDRVRKVYDAVKASRKFWIVHPEYGLTEEELPPEAVLRPDADDESIFIRHVAALLKEVGVDIASCSLAVDLTGLMRPHLLYLVHFLQKQGVKSFHAIYAEPTRYKKKENTSFSSGTMSDVRPVQGYEGSPNPISEDDFMIIGMGYDDRMMQEAAEDKSEALKFQLFGLPSLRADMYQESVIRSRRVADAIGDPEFDPQHRGFAPANDPFATAQVLSDVVEHRRSRGPITNLYLSPLGTKAQTLGFALFYIFECVGKNVTITFPFSTAYAAETSEGLARAWCYTVEFP